MIMEPCKACSGRGTIPHQKRRFEDGSIDRSDMQLHEICERCGGGGSMPTDTKTILEPAKPACYVGEPYKTQWFWPRLTFKPEAAQIDWANLRIDVERLEEIVELLRHRGMAPPRR